MSFLANRNVRIFNSTMSVSTLNTSAMAISTLTGSTMNVSSINVSTLSGSTITASTMTGNQITISTLTVSSINNGTPGVAAYSTFNASSINVTSTTTTSTLSTLLVNTGSLNSSGNIIQASGIFYKNSATANSYMTMNGGDANNSPFMEFYYGGLRRCYIGNATASSFELYCQNNTDLNIYTGGSLRMIVSNGGNVSIGTATATAKLTISGTQGGEIAHFLSGSGGANMWFGTLGSTRNAGTILWRQIGSGSTANYLGIGAHGVDDILNVAASGQVGIGITNPSSLLHVAGNIYSSTGISAPSIGASYYGGGDQRGVTNYFKPNSQPAGTFTVGFYGGSPNGYGDGIHFNSYYDGSGGNQNLVLFQKSGIGIRIYQGGWQSASSYSSYADVSLQAGSDIRLKENIQDISDARGMIDILHPKTFYFIKDENKIRQIGFIAQEVRDYYPQFVTGTESETQYLSMEYGKMSPIAIAACKDLYVENDALKARIDILESRLAALEQLLK